MKTLSVEKNVLENIGERSHRGLIPEEVVQILADVNYSAFHLASGRKHVTAKTLKAYEVALRPHFVRVNKSCIVNTQHIARTIPDRSQIELSDGSVVTVARRRRHLLFT
jgi:DNA-binding LytR/AlgR family response regulator